LTLNIEYSAVRAIVRATQVSLHLIGISFCLKPTLSWSPEVVPVVCAKIPLR
jgi:hypothetical protein